MTGRETVFASYAFPPNELGYCGPARRRTTGRTRFRTQRSSTARGPTCRRSPMRPGSPTRSMTTWSATTGSAARCSTRSTPTSCWPACEAHSPARSPACSTTSSPGNALAHHSFHVFVVYPWVRFLDREPATPVPRDAGLPDPMGHRRVRRRRACRHLVAAADIRLTARSGSATPAGSGCGGARTARRWHPPPVAGRPRRRALGLGMRDPHRVRARRAGRCDRSGVVPGQPGSGFGWSIPGSPCSHEQRTGPVRRR